MYVFTSDLHLGPQTPQRQEAFLHMLKDWQRQGVERLYIIGDLFHYWYGPIQGHFHPAKEVLQGLRSFCHSSRRQVWFLAGNRDFLLPPYLEKTWAIPCSSQLLVPLGSELAFLCHGDNLLQESFWERAFRHAFRTISSLGAPAAPPTLPLWVAKFMRRQSQNRSSYRPSVRWNWQEVLRRMGVARYAILGHVHKPSQMRLTTTLGEKTIFTLDEWKDKATYLLWDSGQWFWGENGELTPVERELSAR